MAITQNILNLDAYFRSTPGDKIIINDLNFFSAEDKEKINQSLMTVYDNTDVISTKPSCDCHKTQGRYRIGKLCPECGTECKEPHSKVKPLIWLKALDPDLKFLNPAFWLILSKQLHKNQDYMRYFCDTKYNPPVDLPKHIIGIMNNVLNGIRDYKNTMNNIPNIINFLINSGKNKEPEKQAKLKMLLQMYYHYKDDLFTTYLPIINKKLFVLENTTKGTFTNLISSDIMDVVMTWLKVCSEDNLSSKYKSNTMGTVLSNLSKLYYSYFDKYITSKQGIFRKHVYGARSPFSFRNVIVSIPGKHEYNGIIVPWSVGITAFRPHIVNKLFKRGYSYKHINQLLYRGIKNYEHILDEILQELIKEAPDGKLRVLSQRNPSLKQGSSQYVYIKKFDTNPKNMSMGISALIIKSPNGDYDGDELNQTMLLDNLLSNEFKTLEPYFNVPDVSKPFGISGNLGLLSPATSILSNYLWYKEQPDTKNDKIVDKLELVDI